MVQASGGGIVLVNFNYRVGVLGFLASEAMREDGDLNAGLLDQRKMLQWVQDHIAQVRSLMVQHPNDRQDFDNNMRTDY